MSFSVKARTNRSRPPNSASRSSAGPSTAGRSAAPSWRRSAPWPPGPRRATGRWRRSSPAPGRSDRSRRGTGCSPASSDGSRAAPAASSALRPWAGQIGVHVRRRRRRRRAHQLVHAPTRRAAPARCGRRTRSAAAPRPCPAAPAPRILERHAPELRTEHRRDAVVPREPLVEERVVGGEQVADVAILEQDARHERLDLGRHVAPQLVVEGREQIRIRHHLSRLSRSSHLSAKFRTRLDARGSFSIRSACGLQRARRASAFPPPRRRAAPRPAPGSRGRTTAARPARDRVSGMRLRRARLRVAGRT